MKRAFDENKPELMDCPQPVSPELERDLLNLVALNRYFGGHRITRRFLSAWLQRGRKYRILDLATGAGDMPRLMLDWARTRDISLHIDAVDASPATLEIAQKLSPAHPGINFIQADALTFERDTYDLVCCSLALHHFSDHDAACLLRHCRQLSHRFVLVADLERSPLNSAGIWAVTQFLFTEPMTRHDARLSARRAFSFGEMDTLAHTAGWRGYGHARFAFCRQALWLDEQTPAEIPQPALPLDEAFPCPG